jgi:hypothetical protein
MLAAAVDATSHALPNGSNQVWLLKRPSSAKIFKQLARHKTLSMPSTLCNSAT